MIVADSEASSSGGFPVAAMVGAILGGFALLSLTLGLLGL
jgi:hypothetical protein